LSPYQTGKVTVCGEPLLKSIPFEEEQEGVGKPREKSRIGEGEEDKRV